MRVLKMKKAGLKFLFAVVVLLNMVLSCAQPSVDPTIIHTGAQQTDKWVHLLKGKSIAVVANHSSLIGKIHLVDTMVSMDLRLTGIFSPEHGFRGNVGAGDVVFDSIDIKTSLPVISLYGKKKKPETADMKGIDVVVYDIQDVGVRFYTYISTLHYMMEACAIANIPIIVLDRPNPLGFYIDGPVLDTNFRSFVGMHPIPVVYGMTTGELAEMINNEGWLTHKMKCKLTVIPCENYTHDSLYKIPVNPSPNLRSMEAVYLYPSICFFEGTLMSVGRGTPYPFQVAGHPDYPDASFSFKPVSDRSNLNPLFKNRVCYGIDLRMMGEEELVQIRQLNLTWLINSYMKMNKGASFFNDYFDILAGTDSLRKQILNGMTEEQIRRSWDAELSKFSILRSRYLLYEDFR